jgi:serine/threonine protein kinase
MGEVYRARDTRLERTVAVKVLPTPLADNPEARQRFDREARAISSLNHPHICTLYDVGHQDGIDYLVMEYLEGETLADRLKQAALPLNECLRYGMEICAGLEAAHRAGVVHRDLKPSNIMLTKAGVKLMDFGLAKPVGMRTAAASGSAPAFTAVATISSPSPVTPLTMAGSIVGTIQYMAPEQIEGKEADARSDIFALGSVLYEMTTGKRAFKGKSQISMASAILESDPEPISVTKPMTPAAFEHVVKACLEKDPEHRFQSAHDVKLELQWIAESGTAAAPAAATSSAKRKPWYWLAASLSALILGALLGSFVMPSRQRPG